MKQFFRPLEGCRIVASDKHPARTPMEYLGEVVKVDGNQVVFRNREGDSDHLIWKFKDGLNKYVWFGA